MICILLFLPPSEVALSSDRKKKKEKKRRIDIVLHALILKNATIELHRRKTDFNLLDISELEFERSHSMKFH